MPVKLKNDLYFKCIICCIYFKEMLANSPWNYEIEKIKELLDDFYIKLPIHGYNEEIFQQVGLFSSQKLMQSENFKLSTRSLI